MVRSNTIRNCPLEPEGITTANKFFGPNVASLKGKMTRRVYDPVLTEYTQIPKEIIDPNKNVTLVVDTMCVDSLTYLVSTSRKIKFMITEYVSILLKPILIKPLNKKINVYTNRGFNIGTALMDRKCKPLWGTL
jgi:hypothetical protein